MKETTRIASLAAALLVALASTAPAIDVHDTRLLSDPAITATVLGPRTPEHLTPALDALDHPLTPAERAAIATIAEG